MSQILVTGEAKIRDIQGPVVSNSGVITALDGDASQYVRGDGTLADFPTSTGGGSSVSYYLNSSVSQGTIGGVAYKQLSKTPISGAGTDITASTNGYIASYITDANDPALLEVPAGNFNCEFYFSVNSNNHDPSFYAELYKYDGSTFTLLGSSQSVPEYLSNGTTLSPYYFAIPVATAVLSVTDRLAIRIYVNVDGRVVTLHTENNHLCQVVTTFSKGLTSLNNLTRQVQFLATGTSGTDFAISSSTATHTFNLPVASATNTGKLSSTDWSTFNGKVPYTGATTDVNLGVYDLTATGITANSFYAQGNGTQGGYLYLKQGIVPYGTLAGSNSISADGTKYIYLSDAGSNNSKTAIFQLGSISNNIERTYTLPDLSGTLALLEGTQTFSGNKTFSVLTAFTFLNGTRMDYGLYLSKGSVPSAFSGSTTNIYSDATTNNIVIRDNSSIAKLDFNNSTQTYTFPAASGTLALTSNLSSYLPLAGGTLTGALSGTSATFSSSVTATSGSTLFKEGYIIKATTTSGAGSQPAYTYYTAAGSKRWSSFLDVGSDKFFIANAANSEVFTIQQNGKVGIGGVTNPSYAVSVGSANGDAIGIQNGSANTSNLYFSQYSNEALSYTYIRADARSTGYMAFHTNDTERMRITSGGVVEVGGWGSGTDQVLKIKGNSGGQVGFFNHNGQLYLPFLDSGTGTALVLTSGGFINTLTSSIRYKKDVQPIDIGLDFILSLNPVSYNLKNGDTPQVGFIAEDFPDDRLVAMSMIDREDESKGYQRESVNYAQIVAPLVKAIQEQQAQIEELKALIKNK